MQLLYNLQVKGGMGGSERGGEGGSEVRVGGRKGWGGRGRAIQGTVGEKKGNGFDRMRVAFRKQCKNEKCG